MAPPLFLVPEGRSLASDVVELDGPEGRHAATVRRIAAGEQVLLSDGRGALALCEVRAARKDALSCAVLRRDQVPVPEPRLVVVQALAKAADQAIEQMTEVGVDEIVPWQSARSVVRWRPERAGKGLERWRGTAREAAKQCRRAWVPVVAEPASTADVAARLERAGVAYVLDDGGAEPASIQVPATGDVVVVVGPEGGLNPEELGTLSDAGATRLRLGPTVLRSVTAGTVAAAVLLSRTPRWTRA
ncbi:MAG: 16S rRNA (uracil(1498)-N(3))-methyltransferase [Streptosporangiales bacterium]